MAGLLFGPEICWVQAWTDGCPRDWNGCRAVGLLGCSPSMQGWVWVAPVWVQSHSEGWQGDSPWCHLLLANSLYFSFPGLVLFHTRKSLSPKIYMSWWKMSKRRCASLISSLQRNFVSASTLLTCTGWP